MYSYEEFCDWNNKYQEAMLLDAFEKKSVVDELLKEVENNFELVGISAIEDKLQDVFF